MTTIAQNTIACESKRRLFVGCLASYNSGIIHGEWVDLSDYYDLDELQEKVNAILKSSPCQGEEYDIQDYEGFGDLFKGDYYPSLSKAWAIHETLLEVENEGIDEDLFLDFVSHLGEEIESSLIVKFQDSYNGGYDSLEDYAEQLLEDCGDISSIPKNLRYYIDFERYGKDMEMNGDIFTIETGYRKVHVFSNY